MAIQLLKDINLTDPQGQTWPAATIAVAYATATGYTNESIKRSNVTFEMEVGNTNNSLSITAQYYYWPTETARTDGLTPYILANKLLDENGSPLGTVMSFSFNAADAEYDGMDLEEKCFHYLQTYVLG